MSRHKRRKSLFATHRPRLTEQSIDDESKQLQLEVINLKNDNLKF